MYDNQFAVCVYNGQFDPLPFINPIIENHFYKTGKMPLFIDDGKTVRLFKS